MTTPEQEKPKRIIHDLRAMLAARNSDTTPAPTPAPIRTRNPSYSPPTYEEAFRQSTVGQTEQQRRQRERDEFCRHMAEIHGQRKRHEEPLRSLSSGDQLEYDCQIQQFILGPGQRRLWNVLDDYNTYRLMNCQDMTQDKIREFVQHLDKVPDEILEMVADQMSIEQREIIDKNQPKLTAHPRFGDLARCCATALDTIKELDVLRERRKPPKSPIKRVVL